MKLKIEGWVMRTQYAWSTEPDWSFWACSEKPKADDERIPVCPYTIEIEVPDGDFVLERVEGIRNEMQNIRARAESKVQDLRVVEGKLLALTNEVRV